MPQRRLGKFDVWVYTRDERGHRPHVHVFYAGAEAVILISRAATVREKSRRMRLKDVREAQKVVAQHHRELMRLWRKYNA